MMTIVTIRGHSFFTVIGTIVCVTQLYGSTTGVKVDDDVRRQLDAVEERTDRLTARAVDLEQRIRRRIDWFRTVKAKSLEERVTALSGATCERRYYQCGGHTPQCVNKLFVCDGREDCRNGEDEKRCGSPVAIGERFVGQKIFDTCGEISPDRVSVTVDSVETVSFWTGFLRLKVTIEVEVLGEEGGAQLAFPAFGVYNTADHQMEFEASGSEGVALVGRFDGHDFDHFIGKSIRIASRDVCARFFYTKVA